jgi:transposase (fragment)
LGNAELKNIMFGEYNAYVFIGDELNLAQFKDTFPQVCIFYADNKFVKATNQGNELNAKLFLNDLKDFL